MKAVAQNDRKRMLRMNIYEIAEKCGVSPTTVSRVLNNSSRVSETTRQSVLKVIKETNYTPNALARNLSSGVTKKVGIVCKNIADMFYANTIALIENNLRAYGYDSLLYTSYGDCAQKLAGIRSLASQVDALVFIGSIFDENGVKKKDIEQISETAPIIVVNGYLPFENVYGVVSDETGMTETIVKYMYEAGCRRIMYIYDSMTYSGHCKYEGYKNGLKECGIEFDEKLCCMMPRDLEKAQDGIENFMASGIPFDAVIASEDMFGIVALNILKASGAKCPLVSFNNSILAVCADPKITSVDFMLDTICSTAIGMLSSLLEGKRIPEKVVISPELIVRESFVPRK